MEDALLVDGDTKEANPTGAGSPGIATEVASGVKYSSIGRSKVNPAKAGRPDVASECGVCYLYIPSSGIPVDPASVVAPSVVVGGVDGAGGGQSNACTREKYKKGDAT
jgi:hypothetical protein